MSELKDEVESSFHNIFDKLQNEMKQFLPNEEIRLDTNSILGYHDSVVLDESEFPVKTIGGEKTVKGWSVTIWQHQPSNSRYEPDDYVDKLVGNYRTEEQARLAFIKTIFECKLSDYSDRLGDEEFDRQQAEWEKIENQM